MRRIAFLSLVVAATALCSLGYAGDASALESDAALAQELTNPLANLISMPIQTNYDDGFGTGNGHKTFTNVQPVIPIKLNPDWNMISRTIVPIVWDQVDLSPVGPSGKQAGFGDIVQSLFFSPSQPNAVGSLGNMVWGVGPVAVLPTGNADPLLGSGKWGLGPTAVVLFMNSGWTYGVLANHVWDVAGKGDRVHVSASFLQPFLSYTTKTAWTYTINSESAYDFEGGNWAIPINAMISKLTSIGGQKISLQGGVRYWAASPTGGPDDLGYRFAVTFLFPTKSGS
jgi:hypothetical protein